MAWEENSRICLHMQLIAILSRTGVSFGTFQPYRSKLFDFIIYILSFFLIFISQRAEMLIRDLLMGFSHHVFFDK